MQESFFNFGAASEKWIAPELRVKRIHAPAVHRSSVFRTDSNASSLQVRSSYPCRQENLLCLTPDKCENVKHEIGVRNWSVIQIECVAVRQGSTREAVKRRCQIFQC